MNEKLQPYRGVLVFAFAAVLVVYLLATARAWVGRLPRSARESLAVAMGIPADVAAAASDMVLNEVIASTFTGWAKKAGAWAAIVAVLVGLWKARPIFAAVIGASATAAILGGATVGVAALALRQSGAWEMLKRAVGLEAEGRLCRPGQVAAENSVGLTLCYDPAPGIVGDFPAGDGWGTWV